MTNTRKTAEKATEKTTATTASDKTKAEGFTAEERSAMKERAKEVKASARRGSRAEKAAEEEAAVVAKIAEMQDSDRVMAERIHAVVKECAPELAPKLWYGMPAYAKDGKVVCFFQSAQKFNARYATFGFNDVANLDDGTMWPAAYALKELTAADEARIAELVKKAVS
ncbi:MULTISPECIES: iron chaperone [unclassified Streptomyces]|uniref:iron chaperone n=1 Tax=unclassified Streptomyces TaxID=2593676 RepID=UPI0036B86FFB